MPPPENSPAPVGYLLPDLESGGTENHVLTLAGGIDRQRFSPIVYATAGGGSLEAELERLQVPVRILNRRFSPRRLGIARSLRNAAMLLQQLPRMLRRDRVSILHAYLPAPNVIGSIVGPVSNIRACIVSKRALCNYKEGHRVLSMMENVGNLLSDVILVNSDAVRAEVERSEYFATNKIRKTYNGVLLPEPWSDRDRQTFRERQGLPPNAPVVVTVSNFFPYKAHHDLVDAAAQIVPRIPQTVFVLIGRDAGTMSAVKSKIASLGLASSFRFVGVREDVSDFLRAADLFVHPSLEEGFSNAILEAMAASLPVVACNVGGNPEAVVDRETGLLVPPNDPDALARAIHALLSDPEKAAAMGSAGRARARDQFPAKKMIREIEDLYDDLLGRKQ